MTKSLPGSAPRHFVFQPDGKTLYQLQEQDSRLQVYDFKDGKLTAKGASISTPAGRLSGQQHHLGTADRQGGQASLCRQPHPGLHRHHRGDGGGVKRIANTHTGGNNPRSLTLDPNGKFLYSLNQSGNNVVTFRIGADGVPKYTGKFLGLGSPAVMVFLPELGERVWTSGNF